MSQYDDLDSKLDEIHPGATIIRILGEGASAVIFKVRLTDGTQAFVKYYFKSDADSAVYVKNEPAILTMLCKHPMLSAHVPQVLAYNNSMILMSPVVEELPINQINKAYTIQMVRILRIIHQEFHTVHRDLQPNNILRNNVTNTVVIIDWACSTVTNQSVPYDGTIFYAADEVLPLVFTEVKYDPKPAHDLESIVKILYHVFNQAEVDECEIDICQLNEVSQWWKNALEKTPWPSYLKAARDEDYDALLQIIEQCFNT